MARLMPEISPSRWVTTASWEDVPHLDEDTKRELWNSTPPHLRDARAKGIPSLGSGAIYPIAVEEFEVKPFVLPAYWPRAYALDVGWNRTAGLWGAWDQSDDTLYLYAEYYASQAVPAVHASAIKARGEWIKGVIDPASRGRAQADGEQLFATYRELGLKLSAADNGVESGIYKVWERLSTQRLKVFSTLMNWKAEYRLYRRDESGKIVKSFDHLMDCCRYLVASGRSVATVQKPDRSVMTDRPAIADTRAGY
jgi:hypothetical protein